jgi:phosphatidylglycerophosphate synthase
MAVNDRRPIPFRGTRIAQFMAKIIAKFGISPNQISLLSIFCAFLGAISIVRAYYGWPEGYGLGALFILARLLCNLFDGMVAVEYGKGSASGGLYNELPDRISDVITIMALGVAIDQRELALWASLLAVMTAYIRTLSTHVGAEPDFSGPMAKQQRMFSIMAACLVSNALPAFADVTFLVCLTVIAAGSAITCIRRLFSALRSLDAKG